MSERKKRTLSFIVYDDYFGEGRGLEAVFEEAVRRHVEELKKYHPNSEFDMVEQTSDMLWCAILDKASDEIGDEETTLLMIKKIDDEAKKKRKTLHSERLPKPEDNL